MSRRIQGAVVALMGLAALRLGVTGDLLFYVRDRMRIPMIIAGVVLLATGALTAWPRGETNADSHMPRAAWLLLVPVVALMVFTPRPLGADASVTPGVVTFDPSAQYPPLAPHHGPVEMTLSEYWERARFDPHHSVRGVPVRVVAFVVVDGNTQRLGRYLISCCAADAILLTVDVSAWPQGAPPPNGQWVEAVIRQPLRGAHGTTIRVTVASVRKVDQPSDPYLTP